MEYTAKVQKNEDAASKMVRKSIFEEAFFFYALDSGGKVFEFQYI